jgi:2-iminobutanoate/2-iminopropanoate deaminase
MIRTDKAPAPIGPYSQAILAGGELFCSGQIAIDPESGELTGSDAAAQADQVLRNLGAVLEAAQMDYGNVVKTTIYLIDMNDFAAVNTVYAKYFDASKPARSTVAVAALPKGARVEIDAIAKK